jgi:polysaccharide lyase-like protein
VRKLAVAFTAVVVLLSTAPAAVARVGGFESGGFGEFDWHASANGSLTVSGERAYEGARSAKASSYGSGNQYQRVWYDVAWGEGTDVWYGMALYIPRLSDWCWWTPARWDNYRSYGGGGDVGGLRIEQGRLYLDKGTYAGQRPLIGPVAIPEGRWFWVEVHQRLSAGAGSALSELYLDGVKVGSSTAANTNGRPIDTIRYGNVSMASSCSQPGSIHFDRVSLTDTPLGPAR